VAQLAAQVRVAERARRLHVVLDLDSPSLRARERMKIGVPRCPMCDHGIGSWAPRKAASVEGADQEGACQHRIGHARDSASATSELSRQHADRRRMKSICRPHHSGEQRGARAPDDARKHVAADFVGAESRKAAFGRLCDRAPAGGERI